MNLSFSHAAALVVSLSVVLDKAVLAQQSTVVTCGIDTVFDTNTNSCLCSLCSIPTIDLIEDPNVIDIAGIFDTTAYDWGPTIFQLTVQLINERKIDALVASNQRLEYTLSNAQCDETTAVRAYWDVRSQNNNRPPHGIVGARCSGASISLARVSGLEGVPHLSMASTAAQLSDDDEFPYFSRLVAPDNAEGEVGALVATLRAFDWTEVIIFATDTAFAQGLANEFKKEWNGQHDGWFGRVRHSDTIQIGADKLVDNDSVEQVLGNKILDDPSINSRIILLFAQSQHAFAFLERAVNRQPDTVWVGPSAWVGRQEATTDFRWLPSIPGYLGVAPFRNRDDVYQNFMLELQNFQAANGQELWDDLPTFAAELIDSIVAMTKALSTTSNPRDGFAVVQRLRTLDFDGVSGSVELASTGDRKNPQYSIINAQSSAIDDRIVWTDIGKAGTTIGSTEFKRDVDICFAQQGCGDLNEAPADTYPEIKVPKEPLPWWIFLLLAVSSVALFYVSYRYIRSKRKKRAYKRELEDFRKSVVGMRAAESHYIPIFVENKNGDPLRFSSSKSLGTKSSSAVWCWQETAGCMDQHSSSAVFGDPADCWIKYDQVGNSSLETAFQNKQISHTPRSGYVVDFHSMMQTKTTTSFTRAVKRCVTKGITIPQDGKDLDVSDVKMGILLPDDLQGEPQMVLVEGDVVQITVQRQDGWSFGSKLYQMDENLAMELIVVSTKTAEGIPSDDVNVSSATGWFREGVTRVATETDIKAIQSSIGGEDALSPPSHWDIMQDPTIVERFEIQKDSAEYDVVAQDFLSTLKKVKVVKIERVQNLAMWQSYIVKRQTICYRETGHSDDEVVQHHAIQRYERERLWHGSNVEVVEKILQQGFNRSFCGKNATAYGKGVYYARDASYSASRLYSIPDKKGLQYMMACRVIVGEYCRGKHDVVTPDVRDPLSHQLYDTTVDRIDMPCIYVTYHDAQAYPEYLVTFVTK